MGNRGNVIFTDGERISPCVYLHWNGGPESVYRFLAELDAGELLVRRVLKLLTAKGQEVAPTKPGSDAWLARQSGRWAKLAAKVRNA